METQEEYNIKDKQAAIIDYYGLDNQLNQLVEESSELIQAICKYKREESIDLTNYYDRLFNLIEELGDVKNLIEQVELNSDYIKNGINMNIDNKVNRELDRIGR